MLTQRRVRIVPESFKRPIRPRVVPAAIPEREEHRPPERAGLTAVYGRASGWYYRRERER